LTHKIRRTDYGLTFNITNIWICATCSNIPFSKRIFDGLHDYYFLLQIHHY